MTTQSDLAQLREEVGQLRTGTDGLAQQVGTLAVALSTVNSLQQKQTELDRAVKTVATAVVPEHKIDQKLNEQADVEKIIRKQALRKIYAWTTVIVLVFIAIIIGVVSWQRHLNHNRYEICLNSNKQNAIKRDAVDTYVSGQQQFVSGLPKALNLPPAEVQKLSDSLDPLKKAFDFTPTNCGKLK